MTRPAGAVDDGVQLAVVGSGIAGLYATLLAAESGLNVALLTRGELEDSNSAAAQGGICAVLPERQRAPGDSVAAHIQDTLAAGAGLGDPEAVRILCSSAAEDITSLERFGVRFDRDPSGGYALGLEAAHSHARILHVGGDATGAGLVKALIAAVLDLALEGRVVLLENATVTALMRNSGDEDRVQGVVFERSGRRQSLPAVHVLLTTGGAGRLYARTTNPAGALGEGIGLALEAGAVVTDAEFLQFHPTALRLPGQEQDGWLISEAVRGEGAVLLDADGTRFMPAYHPLAELAPRDVVSRAVARHLNELGTPEGAVFLDARPLAERHGPGFLARRFPSISAALALAGIDWEHETVPVSPAAHYWMGGVATDLWGRSSVPGLWAAGEVACTGVHGANRLASNSLLEGLVFARRAVEAIAEERTEACDARGELTVGSLPVPSAWIGDAADVPAPDLAVLQSLMTADAGMSRTGEALSRLAVILDSWLAERTLEPSFRHSVLAARALVAGALARSASVGAHFRSDAPPEAEPEVQHYGWRTRGAAVVPPVPGQPGQNSRKVSVP
ncbi:L-aspartate oxidase [Arthrobacter sp. NPDC090010]|uniref:L-aspartate oxidase n=1 Tax=Arthrobacter sp. NPDC090010 TaxID=3363942 RepID=UPI00380F272C